MYIHISHYTRLKSDQLVIDSLIHYYSLFFETKKRTGFQVMKSRLILISFWCKIMIRHWTVYVLLSNINVDLNSDINLFTIIIHHSNKVSAAVNYNCRPDA